MNNSFTLKNNKTGYKKDLKASEKTINFLRMVARTYRIEKSFPAAIGRICLN
ncbi:MAG: hypothetical protein LBR34_12175 [Prevotella sp.]|jgi:hypothetical protein|nr:hypothetical protein [Prevotella sp.]